MRIPASVVFLCIVVFGALALAPMVAYLGIAPLPGDVSVNWNGHKIFLPFAQSLIASVSLALLFLWARK